MLEAWIQNPGYFIGLAIVFLGVLIVVLIAFYKNRGFRHIERMKAMELNRVEESFFAGRLLNYVPWQFWTSFCDSSCIDYFVFSYQWREPEGVLGIDQVCHRGGHRLSFR